MKSFASDNYAPVLPEVMEALQRANKEHERSYGADTITERCKDLIRKQLGADVDVYFVYNGTGANVLSISSAVHSYNSVLVADISHFYNDENTAPETFTGCRYFPVETDERGKMKIESLKERIIRKGDVHYAQPAIVSITQSTEYGTLYTPEEIGEISGVCRENGLYLHMDGSRFFNAAAGTGLTLKEMTTDLGIDILSLGGTKAGMMFGEAVIVWNGDLKKHIAYKQKQVMQLHSKTRFIAAQFEAMLTGHCWKKYASQANQMAKHLATALKDIPEVRITRPVEANVVFAIIPDGWNEPLMQLTPFYVWKDATNEVRLMCAWDTTEKEVEDLINGMKKLGKE